MAKLTKNWFNSLIYHLQKKVVIAVAASPVGSGVIRVKVMVVK